MRRCLHFQALHHASRNRLANPLHRQWQRLYSIRSHDRVQVRCGSAGHVSIDLINITEQPDSPLFIQLPASPVDGNQPPHIPRFLQGKPLASINYRWNSFDDESSETIPVDDVWPTPIHDTFFAYQWIVENLAPEGLKRRGIYVYGSHLGASLASSLALSESRPHKPFAVRGLVAYNGIYNWTMFFPDHPANRLGKHANNRTNYFKPREGTYVHYLQQNLPIFFQSTVDMFDVFASPSLFFHNPGIKVPSSYHMSEEESAAIEVLTNPNAEFDMKEKTPRMSRLVFPPRKSTLKIPEALLLYDTLPVPTATNRPGRPFSGKQWGNSLELQARELGEMMQRSIQMVEMKERGLWDADVSMWENEPRRRVKMEHAGEESEDMVMDEKGEKVVEEWLTERLSP
ncbi:hypothetical protein FOCG_02266 [Fusarium oxysporum f. sp. radicis-lycopersici 26381]|uniref:Alpha/beta hydrolase fold-3 domain-containing protein n=1 Tax=Fusarium oxysporum Fo47 TaxID=660027 RepID=W9KLB4_FUSOX|nr:hypothetical protein FOZG_07583 [Fusarium oxysporum Fo47]EXL58827.1 hypothetical protein FOCG_02266 [Fusarium oxysporum f. sp. radicis-lycopersici 26381]KAJ4161154.1 hypothetical protein NW765_006005 [Fusarium oxysporum]KAJ4282444.1 hypothetical protein NW764_003452 [Fusarium oxysporum]